MAKFLDQKGREWNLAIDAPTIMQIREDCDPDFLLNDGEENNSFMRLQADPVFLCRVVFLLTKKDRAEKGITEEDFYFEVVGDAIDRAAEALVETITNFTPRRTRKLLEVFVAQEKLQQEATDRAIARLSDPKLQAQVLGKMEEEIDAQIASVLTLLGSASNAPASSESRQQG